MGGVALTQREPALVTPFWVRIATETSLSPGWLLIAFPAVLYPTYLLLEVLFGRGLAAATDFGGDFRARTVPVMAMFLGYVVMMGTYVARGTIRDLEALRPVLRGGEAALVELRQRLTHFAQRRLWIGGLVGLAISCVVGELIGGRSSQILAQGWSLYDVCNFAVWTAAWIVFGQIAVYLIDSARLYSQIGERHVDLDLLDLAPLLPLTRHGLRIVLLLVILTATGIVSVVVGTAPPESVSVTAMLLNCMLALPLAVPAFVLPVRGLRRQIRACKAEELARVREEIRLDRDIVAKRQSESSEAGARLPGLLAYKNEIESVREWPFDAPTLARFFLYVAIPLGSWVGGALVERLLGAALD
jgi:hypothetical protein